MDYYKILNIEKNSNQSDIKKAYKKLALKYHPDKPTGNESKFKDISEAYDILSNIDKKRMYDNPEYSFNLDNESSFPFFQPFTNINAHDLFNQLFNNNQYQSNFVSISTTTVKYPDGRIETKTTHRSNNNSFI